MKRRDFLASSALLSLFASDALAAKKKAAEPSKAHSSKPASTSSSKKNTKPSSSSKTPVVAAKPKGPVAHTAELPVTEKPPQGSSASRLPPVKAVEAPTEWRTFEVTTALTLKRTSGRTRLWLPLPLNQDTLYQRTLGHYWNDNADIASMRRLPDGNLEVYYCEWTGSTDSPRLELTTTVSTADRHFDVTRRTIPPERDDILRRALQASSLIPNDGLAHQLGENIIGRIKDPVAQAKAIFDWVADNSIYDPSLPGCGKGDVRRQLTTGKYGGRSADINGLFVAICRAIGIPARCVYGLRVAPSRLVRSLGINNSNASRAHHVRAEFYIPGYGWIPVDPSDVRRAIALDGLSDRDSRYLALRKVLFGVWEMNWIAYNLGNDVILPADSSVQPFFLHPVCETSEGRRDGLSPDSFQYSITCREI